MNLFVAILFVFLAGGPDPEPIVEWLTPTTHDFGTLPNTDEVKTVFTFRNITDEPIFLEAVRPGCGCTLPEWSEVPVAPDSLGQLEVWYNPKGSGYFYEKIKVYFNAQRKAERLYVEGDVVE